MKHIAEAIGEIIFILLESKILTKKLLESKDLADLNMYSWVRRKMIRFRAFIIGCISTTWRRKIRY